MAAGLTGGLRPARAGRPVSWKSAAAAASIGLALAACISGEAPSSPTASTASPAAAASSIEATATSRAAPQAASTAADAAAETTAGAPVTEPQNGSGGTPASETPASVPADEPASVPASEPPSDGPQTITAAAGDYEVSFDPEECPFQPPPGVEPQCGYLSVPADRSRPEEGRIRLAAAVFPARLEEKYPPVVYLEGGPGGEALETLPFTYETLVAPLDAERTVILFDQRGVGYSEPSLSCPQTRQLVFDLLAEDLPTEEWLVRFTAVLHECRETWLSGGIDLSNFNSAASAADAADLRAALGYSEWDLYGISYGTRLALTVMRDHPEGVRSAVLDSAYPPQVDEIALILRGASGALDELFSACAADLYCSSTYGDLESLMFSIVDRLNDSPVEIEVIDYFSLRTYPALLDGDALLGLVFQALYAEWTFPRIPKALAEIRDGRYTSAEELMSLFLANEAFFSIGQFLSVGCREEAPFSDLDLVRSERKAHPRLVSLLEGSLIQSERASEFCAAWGAGAADPIENQPVESSIPALVMAGRFDPITPPDFGHRTAEHLDNAWFVEFPTLAHGVTTVEGCPRSIMLDFLADPSAEPNTACVEDMPKVQFP